MHKMQVVGEASRGHKTASMGGRLSLPSRTSEVDEVVTSGSVHAEMIDELSVLTACVARVKP